MKSARDTLMYNEAQESAVTVERQLAQNASLLQALGERPARPTAALHCDVRTR